jgi:hypothetical protein
MIIQFKKFINMFLNLLSKKSNSTIPETIELEITWGDISSGIANSKYGSVLSYSMRRNGMFGYATENCLVLESGDVYYPVVLSDHWEVYINSPKIKSKTLTYFRE